LISEFSQESVSWESFESSCYGIDIKKRFALFCRYLFNYDYSNLSTSKPDELGTRFNCLYVFRNRKQPNERKTIKNFFDSIKEVSFTRNMVFYTNINVGQSIVDEYLKKNVFIVSGKEILKKAQNLPIYIKKYFFSEVFLSTKWYKDHIKNEIKKICYEDKLCTIEDENIIIDLLEFQCIPEFLTPSLSIFSNNDRSATWFNLKKKNLLAKSYECLEKNKTVANYHSLVKINFSIKRIKDVTYNTLEDALEWKEQIERENKREFESLNDDERNYFDLNDIDFCSEKKLLESKLLLFNGRDNREFLLNHAKDLICHNYKCIYVDTYGFSNYKTLKEQIAEYIGLGYSFEELLTYIDLSAIESGDSYFTFFIQTKVIKNEYLSIIDCIQKTKRIKLIIGYCEIEKIVEDVLKKRDIFLILSSIEESSKAKITSKDIVTSGLKKGIPFSSSLFFSMQEFFPLPPFLSYNLIERGELSFDIIKAYEMAIEQKCHSFAETINVFNPTSSLSSLEQLFYDIIDMISKELYKSKSFIQRDILKDNSFLESYSLNSDYIIDLLMKLNLLNLKVDNSGEKILPSNYGLYLFSKYITKNICKEELLSFLKEVFLECNLTLFNYDYSYSFLGFVSYFYAEEYKEELLTFIYGLEGINNNIYGRLIDVYYLFLNYRKVHYLGDVFKNDNYSLEKILDCFLKNSSNPSSPFNPYLLGKYLKQLDLSTFDERWTTYFVNRNFDTCFRKLFLEITKCDIKLSIEERRSILFFLAWLLSSSDIEIRDMVSDSMIKLLLPYPEISLSLLSFFQDVRDQYILERLFEIINYVLSITKINKGEYLSIVSFIYKFVFDKEEVYPNIIIRDSSYQIIERFISCSKEFSDKFNKHIPPYKSKPIDWDKYTNSYGKLRSSKGCRLIVDSMEHLCYEGISEPYWGCTTFRSSLPKLPREERELIKNYCLFLIFEKYKYSENKFGSSDSAYVTSELTLNNRIGGKYQWIAYHEALAHIYDEYKVNIYEKNNIFLPFAFRTYYPNVQNSAGKLINEAKNKFDIAYKYAFDVFNSIVLKNQDETNKWIKHFDEQNIIDFLLSFIISNSKWLNIASKLAVETMDGCFSLELIAVLMTDEQFLKLEEIKKRKEIFVCHDVFIDESTHFDEFFNKISSNCIVNENDINSDFYLYLNKVENFSSSIKTRIDIGDVSMLTKRIELNKDTEVNLIIPSFSLINKLDLKSQDLTMSKWQYEDNLFSFYNCTDNNNYSFYINEKLLEKKCKNKKIVWFCRLDKTFEHELYTHFGFITRNNNNLDKYLFPTGKV